MYDLQKPKKYQKFVTSHQPLLPRPLRKRHSTNAGKVDNSCKFCPILNTFFLLECLQLHSQPVAKTKKKIFGCCLIFSINTFKKFFGYYNYKYGKIEYKNF